MKDIIVSIDVISYYAIRKPESNAIQENAFFDIINYNCQMTFHNALKQLSTPKQLIISFLKFYLRIIIFKTNFFK